MKNSFWNGRRVLITGHTGFKGSWLTLWLKNLGASICGYALKPESKKSLFYEADVSKGIESNFANILNYNYLYSAYTHTVSAFFYLLQLIFLVLAKA